MCEFNSKENFSHSISQGVLRHQSICWIHLYACLPLNICKNIIHRSVVVKLLFISKLNTSKHTYSVYKCSLSQWWHIRLLAFSMHMWVWIQTRVHITYALQIKLFNIICSFIPTLKISLISPIFDYFFMNMNEHRFKLKRVRCKSIESNTFYAILCLT